MSAYLKFPATVPFSFPLERGRIHNNIRQQSENGVEQIRAKWGAHKRAFKFAFTMLTQAEHDELVAFYNARMTDGAPFLFDDPRDASTTGAAATPSIGDGIEVLFSLPHRYIDAGTITVYLDGAPQASGWTLADDAGQVTFDTPPGAGVAVTADYRALIKLRFDADQLRTTEGKYKIFSADLSATEVWP